MGDGFAMPTTQTPEEMLETAIGRLMRGEPGVRLRSIAMRPDCRLDVAELWALLRINRYQRALGIARITDIENSSGFRTKSSNPPSIAWSAAVTRNATSTGMAHPGRPVKSTSLVTAAGVGHRQAHPLTELQGRPDRAQIEAALNRITHRIVAQPDWESHPSLLHSGFTRAFTTSFGRTISP